MLFLLHGRYFYDILVECNLARIQNRTMRFSSHSNGHKLLVFEFVCDQEEELYRASSKKAKIFEDGMVYG